MRTFYNDLMSAIDQNKRHGAKKHKQHSVEKLSKGAQRLHQRTRCREKGIIWTSLNMGPDFRVERKRRPELSKSRVLP